MSFWLIPASETGGAPQHGATRVAGIAEAALTGRAARKAAMPFIMLAVLIDMIASA